MDHPILTITGDKVALGPQSRTLLPLYTRWVNDPEVARGLGMLPPQTEEQEWAWHETNMKGDTAVVFTIYELSSLRPIGNTGLFDISYRHRRAEFRIIIGERDRWGLGYGTEVTRLVLEYGFTRLGLHNIMLRVFGYNERAQRAYARAGFKTIGRWRQAHNHGTQYDDVILMDCLSTEFPPQPGKQ